MKNLKNINLKYRADKLFLKVLTDQLQSFDFDYKLSNGTVVALNKTLNEADFETLKLSLEAYGIEIVQDPRISLIQNIKELLSQYIHNHEECAKLKLCDYLADRLPYSYPYLHQLFSKYTNYSIGKFLILKKIDIVKKLIIEDHYTLTEIAYKLNYSSVAHLSTQFKNTTGLAPTAFYELIKKQEQYPTNSIEPLSLSPQIFAS